MGFRRSVISTLSTLLFLSFFLTACDWSITDRGGVPSLAEQIGLSPRENVEAEQMALWLSGGVVAPESLYHGIASGLELMRETYEDTITELQDVRFIPPVTPSGITLLLSDSVALLALQGEYHEWDALNNLFRVSDITVVSVDTQTIYNEFLLEFDPVLNSQYLAKAYDRLKGVEQATFETRVIDFTVPLIEIANILPREENSGYTFLLWFAYETPCLSCNIPLYVYFVNGEDGYEIVGLWRSEFEDEPDWWADARVAKDRLDEEGRELTRTD